MDINNDEMPSSSPSLKTVLIVLCSLALIVTVVTFHTQLGL
jgi:hypothetical protein